MAAYETRQIDDIAYSSFFGYYDKSPLNHTQRSILYHATSCDTAQDPSPNIPVRVVVRQRAANIVTDTLESTAYNWQQGTRLQWLSDTRFIYNDYDGYKRTYQSHIYDINMHKIVATIGVPIYDCYADQFALTLNFSRLSLLAPDYGYFCKSDETNLEELDGDGVWRVDLLTGKTKLITGLSALLAIAPTRAMKAAQHSVNHIMISPDGSKFVVIHRWYSGRKRHDRLFLAATDGSSPALLADEGMVSHCFWLSNSRLLCYMRHDGRSGYHCIDVDRHGATAMEGSIFDRFGDGHPSAIGTKVVFDTYPNSARMQRLFLYDMASNDLKWLGEFYAPLRFSGQIRCDLHPRFSRDGACVFFDSAHTGRRQIYEMDLSKTAV